MKKSFKISFCIPSLNRPEYLLNAIESITNQIDFTNDIEICIYNNSSDTSYSNIENYLKNLLNTNIIYRKGNVRLGIDDSMHEVIKMARGEYLYLLGDDDFLLPNSLKTILDLIRESEFDLVIFNAIIYNEKNNTRTKMFSYNTIKLEKLDFVLNEFKNYCSYGNILLKSELLKPKDFEYLKGTSHAYGCFWLSFFRLYELGIEPKVLISSAEVVTLRAILKTYNLLRVTFEDSQKEFDLYYKAIGEKSKIILMKYEKSFWENQSRFLTLLKYGLARNNLYKLKSYNKKFYNSFYFKIHFVRICSFFILPLKGVLKFFIFRYKKI